MSTGKKATRRAERIAQAIERNGGVDLKQIDKEPEPVKINLEPVSKIELNEDNKKELLVLTEKQLKELMNAKQ